MRIARSMLVAAASAAVLAGLVAPAHAGPPEIVTIEEGPAFNCVQEPCPTPPSYRVCVKPIDYCTW